MRPFGSKRIYAGCVVRRAGWGKKVHMLQLVKSKKLGRIIDWRLCER